MDTINLRTGGMDVVVPCIRTAMTICGREIDVAVHRPIRGAEGCLLHVSEVHTGFLLMEIRHGKPGDSLDKFRVWVIRNKIQKEWGFREASRPYNKDAIDNFFHQIEMAKESNGH